MATKHNRNHDWELIWTEDGWDYPDPPQAIDLRPKVKYSRVLSGDEVRDLLDRKAREKREGKIRRSYGRHGGVRCTRSGMV